jgi:hypothetical protein
MKINVIKEAVNKRTEEYILQIKTAQDEEAAKQAALYQQPFGQ